MVYKSVSIICIPRAFHADLVCEQCHLKMIWFCQIFAHIVVLPVSNEMATFATVSRFFFVSSILVFTTAQSLICGTLGYHDDSISYYGGNFFYGAQSSFTICAAYCKQDQSCKGFRYSYWSDSGSQYCEFFNVDP